MLMLNARMVALNANDSRVCSSTTLRIATAQTATSDVCEATAIVNEKYRKST